MNQSRRLKGVTCPKPGHLVRCQTTKFPVHHVQKFPRGCTSSRLPGSWRSSELVHGSNPNVPND
jgi:hypothetical protein